MNHVAIIMDGNGRWAKERNRPRVWGHIRGSYLVAEIVEKADEMGVKFLTLYALSYENLGRPDSELKVLFKLLEKYLKKERSRILSNNIKFKVIGDYSFVSDKLQSLILKMEEETKDATGLNLSFAFGHSGRKTIENCVDYFKDNAHEFSEQNMNDYFNGEVPNVDLMIRTGGDKRISNFLLWQLAYAELCFVDTKWPDFSIELFEKLVVMNQKVEKRYGGLGDFHAIEDAVESAALKLKKGIL